MIDNNVSDRSETWRCISCERAVAPRGALITSDAVVFCKRARCKIAHANHVAVHHILGPDYIKSDAYYR